MDHSRVKQCKKSYQQESAGVLETELRRFLRLKEVEEMEIDKLLHWEYLPELAPVISPDPPEPMCCTQFERCKGCPYPAHGFLCWGQDGECLRTMTEKKERK